MNSKQLDNINHYNQWLTDNIKRYIRNVDKKLKFLFKSFESFSKMDELFGLGSNYLYDQRQEKYRKKVLAVTVIDKMRSSLKNHVEKWINTYPYLSELLLNVQKEILLIFDEYENFLNPKPTPRCQIYIHHPNFIRDYFKVIDKKEKSYWLGFLFADGWITIKHLKSGDYYRTGIEISEKDVRLLYKLCEDIGLNKKYIRYRMRDCSFTGKKYPMVGIKWQNQEFGKYLIELGMGYEFDGEKGYRMKKIKLPILKNRKLMLAFLLGFFDGDGSVNFSEDGNSAYPTIISSDKIFLEEIRSYFEIKRSIYTKSQYRYSLKTQMISYSECYSLPLGFELYREMLENYKRSLERKRADSIFFEDYGLTKQQRWVKSVLKKEDLEKMLLVLSPNYIANRLELSITAIKWLIKKVYRLKIRKNGRKYYNTINKSINSEGKNSVHYEEWSYWDDYLNNLEKFKKD